MSLGPGSPSLEWGPGKVTSVYVSGTYLGRSVSIEVPPTATVRLTFNDEVVDLKPPADKRSKRPCHVPHCGGAEIEQETEYGSLATGGSYEVFKCDRCGNVCRSQLPD